MSGHVNREGAGAPLAARCVTDSSGSSSSRACPWCARSPSPEPFPARDPVAVLVRHADVQAFADAQTRRAECREALSQRLDVPARVVGCRHLHPLDSMAARTRGRVGVPMPSPAPEHRLRGDGERMTTDNPYKSQNVYHDSRKEHDNITRIRSRIAYFQ